MGFKPRTFCVTDGHSTSRHNNLQMAKVLNVLINTIATILKKHWIKLHIFFFLRMFFWQSDILGSYVRIQECTSKNRTEPNLCRFWNRLWKSFSASNKTNVYSIFFHLFKKKNFDLHKIMMFLLRIIWSENAEIFTGLTVKSLIRSVRPVLLRISGLIQFIEK